MPRLNNVHPGEVLQEEFLTPLNITPYRLAKGIGVQQTRIERILDGKTSITPDTAIRLGAYFHVTPHFWLNLQQFYDLERERNNPAHKAEYEQIRAYDVQTSPGRSAS